jgi:hypothetical protein
VAAPPPCQVVDASGTIVKVDFHQLSKSPVLKLSMAPGQAVGGGGGAAGVTPGLPWVLVLNDPQVVRWVLWTGLVSTLGRGGTQHMA